MARVVRRDVGVRIRADARFVRLVDKAAELTGKSRSSFIRDAALAEAASVIRIHGEGPMRQRPSLWIRTSVKGGDDSE